MSKEPYAMKAVERHSNNILERWIPDDDGEEIGRTSVKVEGTI